MYTFLQSFQGRGTKNFNAAIHDWLLRIEAVVRRVALWPKWFGYQVRRTRESYWPAYRAAIDCKPWHRVARELVGLTMRWRCIPFHYFRYGLYRRAISTGQASQFLPESVMYYRLLPKINSACLLLDDKVVAKHALIAHRIDVPTTVIWTAVGRIWSPAGREIACDTRLRALCASAPSDLVLKPASFGSGGATISIFSRNGDSHTDATTGAVLNLDLLRSLKGKWLLETYVPQHPSTGDIHPASLNTFRVVTAISAGHGIEVLYCILKCGVGGRRTDNAHTDGVYIGVDLETGMLAPQAFDENLRSHWVHPTTSVAFAGRCIKHIAAIKDVAVRSAALFPDMGLVGWDIALRSDGTPIVIEGNSSPGLTIIQRTSGGMAPAMFIRWPR